MEINNKNLDKLANELIKNPTCEKVCAFRWEIAEIDEDLTEIEVYVIDEEYSSMPYIAKVELSFASFLMQADEFGELIKIV